MQYKPQISAEWRNSSQTMQCLGEVESQLRSLNVCAKLTVSELSSIYVLDQTLQTPEFITNFITWKSEEA